MFRKLTLNLFREMSIGLFGTPKKTRFHRTLLYRPQSLGGLGLPDLWRYYLAARFIQTAQWHAPILDIPWLAFVHIQYIRTISLAYYDPYSST